MKRAWLLALAVGSGSEPARLVQEVVPDARAAEPSPAAATYEAINPILGADRPDPHILRAVEGGRPAYYLTATSGSGADIPVLRSNDLLTWKQLPKKLLDRPTTPGGSTPLHGRHYCNVWAPEIVQLGPSSFMLQFTATRFAAAQPSCPGTDEDSGVYVAWSDKPTGPFARDDRPGEPFATGARSGSCALRERLPRSLDVAEGDCKGGPCHQIMRLDSTVFRDEADGRWWMAYAWYTNSPTKVAWEASNHGEHVNLVELDPKDPFAVRCDAAAAQVNVVNAHDPVLKSQLQNGCERCGEMLSFSRGRFDEEMVRDGHRWGVSEAPSLLRRNGWVYAFFSHSAWDSAFYAVSWVAARTVEELATGSPTRISGRYLIPSNGLSFGHGSPVLGPDGRSHYYVHHRLQHGACKATGACARDVWISPLEFEDRGDGRGDAWIKPRFPAEDPKVRVTVPA
ncbi:MAG: family 43 glycosylhydrolase [Deltaproteobacteria bacterium]|nr:family 43 glycosylhydrolase [Deltaproteobacteria bacterium]